MGDAAQDRRAQPRHPRRITDAAYAELHWTYSQVGLDALPVGALRSGQVVHHPADATYPARRWCTSTVSALRCEHGPQRSRGGAGLELSQPPPLGACCDRTAVHNPHRIEQGRATPLYRVTIFLSHRPPWSANDKPEGGTSCSIRADPHARTTQTRHGIGVPGEKQPTPPITLVSESRHR